MKTELNKDQTRHNHRLILILIGLIAAANTVWAADSLLISGSGPVGDVPVECVLYDFNNKGFTYAFNDFDKKAVKGSKTLKISDTKDAGGAGIVMPLDLRGYEEGMFRLRIKIGAQHESLWLSLYLQDQVHLTPAQGGSQLAGIAHDVRLCSGDECQLHLCLNGR